MKLQRTLGVAILLASIASIAIAAATPQEAARLGKDLTPWGARAIEEEDEIARLRKFGSPAIGRIAEAAVFGIIRFGESGQRGGGQCVVERHAQRAAAFFHFGLRELDDRGGIAADAIGLFGPNLLNLLRDLQKAGHSLPVAVAGRKVRAADKRLGLGREEHRERPAAAAAAAGELVIDVEGRHVDRVDVGPLLAIDLDADEVLVQELCDFRVFEALPLHHMAPVATGIADREEDHLAFAFGLFERFRPPRKPIDRVVGVLQEVGTRLFRQAVRRLCRLSRRQRRRAGTAQKQSGLTVSKAASFSLSLPVLWLLNNRNRSHPTPGALWGRCRGSHVIRLMRFEALKFGNLLGADLLESRYGQWVVSLC